MSLYPPAQGRAGKPLAAADDRLLDDLSRRCFLYFREQSDADARIAGVCARWHPGFRLTGLRPVRRRAGDKGYLKTRCHVNPRYARRAIYVFLSVGIGLAQNTPSLPVLPLPLNVVVTDKSGKPVPGLEERDFTLLDNKHPQKITSFEEVRGNAGHAPLEVILLMDNVNTRITNVAYERQQVERFLERYHGALSHPTALAFLSDTGLTITNPSQDGKVLVGELNANEARLRFLNRKEGLYADGELLQISLNAVGQLIQKEGPKAGRKLVVWISPGWPLLTGPDIQLSSKDREELFQNIVALSDDLRKADMTISNVDPLGTADSGSFRTFAWKDYTKGVKKPDGVQFGNVALQVLAFQSGGRVLNSSNDVVSEIATAVSDSDTYYVLQFDPSPAEAANQYHSIEVKVDKPGLVVRTSTGYYAQP